MKDLRIGIAGAGNISRTHARAAQQVAGVRLVGVWGRNRKKSEQFAGDFGIPAFGTYEALLSSGLDIVLLGTPSGVHAEQGIAAAQRGIHVLTEKPVDIHLDRVDALIEACEAAGVKLGVFFQDRVAPDIVELKRRVDGGYYGRPLLVTAQVKWYRPPEYYGDSSWRGTWALDGGGAVMNQGIHTVDLVQWLMGPVATVEARTGTLYHDIETEDTAVVLLEFASGALGTYEATTVAFPGFPRRVVISGTEGSALLEHDRIVFSQTRTDAAGAGASAVYADRNLSEATPVVSNVEGHRRILEDFVAAIREGREPLCNGREGRKSVAIVEAIYESAKTRRPVRPRYV
ncbi:MAG: Gfo/Idh/MocA family oxidoreductase [Acidobacteriota bacterium]